MRGRHAKTATTAKRAGKDVPIEAPPGMTWLFDTNPAFTGRIGQIGQLVLAPEGSKIEYGMVLLPDDEDRQGGLALRSAIPGGGGWYWFGEFGNRESISSPRQMRRASKRIAKRYREYVRAAGERTRARARIIEGLEK